MQDTMVLLTFVTFQFLYPSTNTKSLPCYLIIYVASIPFFPQTPHNPAQWYEEEREQEKFSLLILHILA